MNRPLVQGVLPCRVYGEDETWQKNDEERHRTGNVLLLQ